MKVNPLSALNARQLFGSTMSEKGRLGLTTLTKRFPTVSTSRNLLEVITSHLKEEGFSYREKIASLDDVITLRGGSCLGLSLLVTALLLMQGRTPKCKMLMHPYDAVDDADQKLFSSLMQGEYFDYNHPVIPNVRDQPPVGERCNRFVPLCHPIVILDGIPLETTSMMSEDDPFVEYPAETVSLHDPEVLVSHLYSDQAKNLLYSFGNALPKASAVEVKRLAEMSLEIFPNNRDGYMLLWQLAQRCEDEDMKKSARDRLVALEGDDSDLSYKRWLVTEDIYYLDLTLKQFPQHIPAFLDRRVFLEKDELEARMNLAVSLWCINYSCVFDLRLFMREKQILRKAKELGLKN